MGPDHQKFTPHSWLRRTSIPSRIREAIPSRTKKKSPGVHPYRIFRKILLYEETINPKSRPSSWPGGPLPGNKPFRAATKKMLEKCQDPDHRGRGGANRTPPVRIG